MNPDIRTSRYGLGAIMKTGWSEFIKNFRTIIPIALLIYIPVNILSLFIPAKLSIISEIINLLVTVSIAKIIEESVLGNHISPFYAFYFSLMRWGSVCWVFVLLALLMLILLLALVIPAIIFFPYFVFATYAVALRGIPGGRGIDYSSDLVKGQWRRAFLYTVIIEGIFIALALLLVLPIFFLPENVILRLVIVSAVDIVSLPFTVMMIIFFLNCDYLKNKPAEVPAEDIHEAP